MAWNAQPDSGLKFHIRVGQTCWHVTKCWRTEANQYRHQHAQRNLLRSRIHFFMMPNKEKTGRNKEAGRPSFRAVRIMKLLLASFYIIHNLSI